MAQTASPSPARGISVAADPFSGSANYVATKHAAMMNQDIVTIMQETLKVGYAYYQHGVEITGQWMDMVDSMVGGKGRAKAGRSEPPALKRADAASNNLFGFLMSLWSDQETGMLDSQLANSHAFAEGMIRYGFCLPPDSQVNQTLNNRFFTHYADGSLHEVKAEALRRQFDSPHTEDWPNVILTSSHALVRDHEDVSGIMKGWHAMMTHAFTRDGTANKKLALISEPEREKAGSGKPTIIVSSVYNDHNAWVNGGKLLLRLAHQRTLLDAGKSRIRPQDYLRDISPAAIRLGLLMLYLIVEDPAQVAIPPAIDPNRDYRPEKFLLHPEKPLRLRANAAEILAHLKPMGYSKGGNIVSDAVGFLALQLDQPGLFTGAGLADGQDDAARRQVIARLIHPLGILCVNPGICPLNNYEKSLGLRRVTFRNRFDRITAHLFKKFEGQYGLGDDVYAINGRQEELGHGIVAALGDEKNPGYLTDDRKVEAADKLRFAEGLSRIQTYCASCIDALGISYLWYRTPDKATGETAGQLIIEFSGGATESRIRSFTPRILDALRDASPGDSLEPIANDPKGCWRLSFLAASDHAGKLHREGLKERIVEAFRRIDADKTDQLFVSHTTLNALAQGRHL